MKKVLFILGLILLTEIILYLISPVKRGFRDGANLEQGYLVTLGISLFVFIFGIRKWDVSEKAFFGIIFILYLLVHYLDYLL